MTNKATKTIVVLSILAITAYPFCVQAGIFGVFAWTKYGVKAVDSQNKVLSLNTIASKEEELASPKQNILNMKVLEAPNSSELRKQQTASSLAMIDGSAFTNENNSLDGSFDADEDIGSDQISLYTVRKGDTVSLVAKMFGVTPNTIYWANDLKVGAEIKPDQVIVILPITGIKYVVKKGDRVEDLAKKFRADLSEIVSFNNIDLEVGLTVGQEIIIPNADPEPEKTPTKKKASSKTSKNTVGYFKKPVGSGIKTQGVHGNNGVDFASFGGSYIPIVAAAEGTVIISKSGGWNGGYGNYIVIKHSNGTQTLYGHLSSNSVGAGAHVSKGQQIGKMGNTGKSTGVHLHFEVRGGKNPF